MGIPVLVEVVDATADLLEEVFEEWEVGEHSFGILNKVEQIFLAQLHNHHRVRLQRFFFSLANFEGLWDLHPHAWAVFAIKIERFYDVWVG